jgi:hypothetical protein
MGAHYCLSHIPAHFTLVLLETGSCFLPRMAWITILFFFKLPTVAGMTGTYHHAQPFFHWDGVFQTFFALAGPESRSSCISASQVARITGMATSTQLKDKNFKFTLKNIYWVPLCVRHHFKHLGLNIKQNKCIPVLVVNVYII